MQIIRSLLIQFQYPVLNSDNISMAFANTCKCYLYAIMSSLFVLKLSKHRFLLEIFTHVSLKVGVYWEIHIGKACP